HRDGLVLAEGGHPGHAHQPGPAVDLRRARTAFAGLAVPAHGKVRGLRLLQAVDDVEHHLALVDLDLVVDKCTAFEVAAPHPHVRRIGHYLLRSGCRASSPSVKYFSSSESSNRSSRS